MGPLLQYGYQAVWYKSASANCVTPCKVRRVVGSAGWVVELPQPLAAGCSNCTGLAWWIDGSPARWLDQATMRPLPQIKNCAAGRCYSDHGCEVCRDGEACAWGCAQLRPPASCAGDAPTQRRPVSAVLAGRPYCNATRPPSSLRHTGYYQTLTGTCKRCLVPHCQTCASPDTCQVGDPARIATLLLLGRLLAQPSGSRCTLPPLLSRLPPANTCPPSCRLLQECAPGYIFGSGRRAGTCIKVTGPGHFVPGPQATDRAVIIHDMEAAAAAAASVVEGV